MPRKSAETDIRSSGIASHIMHLTTYCPRQYTWDDTKGVHHRMPATQVHLLLMLREHDLAITAISEAMGIAKPNVTPMVDRLAEAGYVKRIKDTKDHRVVRVHLQPRGKTCLQQVEKSLDASLEAKLEAAGKEKEAQLLEALAQLDSLMTELDP